MGKSRNMSTNAMADSIAATARFLARVGVPERKAAGSAYLGET